MHHFCVRSGATLDMNMFEVHILQIFLAALAGGAIGLEREYRDKSAGFRTMILIATGSAMFTIFSVELGSDSTDAARIAAAIVSGIGFLGAGVILKDGVSVHGMTTAASIWLVAALGMAMGLGYYQEASFVTIGILTVLWFFPRFERYVNTLHEFMTFTITVKNSDKEEEKVFHIIHASDVQIVHVTRFQEDSKERTLRVKLMASGAQIEVLGRALANEKAVLRFDARSPR